MAKDKIDKVKSSKLFRGWDILIYALLLVLILVLLWAFIWRVPKVDLEEVEVLIKDDVVLNYNFTTDKLTYDDTYMEMRKEDNKLFIKIFVDDKHFNQVVIDKENKTAYIDEANCSSSKECTKMKPITKGGESVICVPHQLILRAKGEEIIKDPISG